MAFYTDWGVDDFKRLHVREVPDRIRATLLLPPEVNRRLEVGENPIALSIEKWLKLKSAFNALRDEGFAYKYLGDLREQYIGSESCALCISSSRQFETENGPVRSNTDKCKKCPLASVELCPDKDSAYSRLENLLHDRNGFDHAQESMNVLYSEIDSHIDHMIANLNSLSSGTAHNSR